ncbi:MAG: ATP-binding protein [Nitrospirota bacterium]
MNRRKTAEDLLRESEQRYRRLLDSVTDYIYTVRLENGTAAATFHGDACLAVTGYKPEDYAADPLLWYRMVFEDDRKAVQDRITAVLRGETPPQIEHRIVHRNGSIRWVRNAVVPRHDEQGRLIGYDGLVKDITHRRKVEEQLQHAQKMEAIGQLAGGIAHDFNNILTAMIGYGSVMKMDMKDGDPQGEHIDHILALADRAAELTQRLLLFSRKQAGNLKPLDLNKAVGKAKKLLKSLIGEDIDFQLMSCPASTAGAAAGPENLIVRADTAQLEQVLMNLAANARDAMPGGGRLIIETGLYEMDDDFVRAHGYGTPGRYAFMGVTDTGTGMDENTQKRVFEPFFTTKEVGKGTGLGLSVVYGIVKQHNGYITVSSEPGKGAAFRVYLPIIHGEAEREKTAETPVPQRGRETVLLAEDDADVRRFMKSVLDKFGYRVITATDGKEAVHKYRKHRGRVELLLFDLVMPRKTGKKAYEEIRKMTPDIKVLFSSGYAPDIIRQRALLDDNMPVAYKPISPTDLLAKVRDVLDKGKASQG